MDDDTRTALEAAAFRTLVAHLRERTDVQNIDLMNLAGFCRNCLSKWYRAAAEEQEGRLVERVSVLTAKVADLTSSNSSEWCCDTACITLV